MRKMIWSAAAVAIVSVAGLYWAVDYAAKNPQSWIGRIVVNTSGIGAKCTPLAAIPGFHQQPLAVGDNENEQQVRPVAAKPRQQVVEPIVVEFPEERLANFIRILESDKNRTAGTDKPAGRQNETPMFMPYAKEDQAKFTEQVKCEAREGCRYVLKSAQASWIWSGMVRVANYFQPTEMPSDVKPAVNETAPTNSNQNGEKMPSVDEPETSAYPHHHHHSGCPYFGGFRCRDLYTPATTPTQNGEGSK